MQSRSLATDTNLTVPSILDTQCTVSENLVLGIDPELLEFHAQSGLIHRTGHFDRNSNDFPKQLLSFNLTMLEIVCFLIESRWPTR